MPKKSKISEMNNPSPRELQRSYILSHAAHTILENARDSGMTKNDFVSKCIEDYGPILIRKLQMPSLEDIKAKLEYLEAAIGPLTYQWIMTHLENREKKTKGTIKAHQDVLRGAEATDWLRDLEKVMELAQNDKRTKKTPSHVWCTLIRRRSKFLNEGDDEEIDVVEGGSLDD